jgi:hypothetical protein
MPAHGGAMISPRPLGFAAPERYPVPGEPLTTSFLPRMELEFESMNDAAMHAATMFGATGTKPVLGSSTS